MDILLNLIRKLFVYCVDFIINLAHISGLSYYEVNALIFVLLWPLLTLALLLAVGFRGFRIYLLKNSQSRNDR